MTETCIDCLPGAYQDLEGQLTCEVCPLRHMSTAGAYNITQCKFILSKGMKSKISNLKLRTGRTVQMNTPGSKFELALSTKLKRQVTD